MDISGQVFRRSARMGILYVAIGVVMAVAVSATLDFATGVVNTQGANVKGVDIAGALGMISIPFAALGGLIVTTPVYLLFVSDKNEGVLEYLLAVGMGQRDVFAGYLKAALALAMVAVVPAVAINLALAPNGMAVALEGAGLSLLTAVADVSLVTVLMTSFSSMQRRPTGMNSPLGISIGIFSLLPELMLFAVLGTAILWLDLFIAVAVSVVALGLLLSLDRLIRREKLLP